MEQTSVDQRAGVGMAAASGGQESREEAEAVRAAEGRAGRVILCALQCKATLTLGLRAQYSQHLTPAN